MTRVTRTRNFIPVEGKKNDRHVNYPTMGNSPPIYGEHANYMLIPSEALRTMESLNGRNDTGVEKFIKSIKFTRTRNDDKESLLHMILTKKIIENAKQNIRFCQISNYDNLYKALYTQLSTLSTVSESRNKMQSIKQSTTESVQSYFDFTRL